MTSTTLAAYALPMQQDVALFHDAFGLPNLIATPGPLPLDRIELRIGLIQEEGIVELGDAIAKNDIVEMIDALIDTVYVSLGALAEMGRNVDAGILSENDNRLATQDRPLAETAKTSLSITSMYVVVLGNAFRKQDVEHSAEILSIIVKSALLALIQARIDAQPFFDEVQRANMSKLGSDGKPVHSRGMELDGAPEGKVLKGANYSPPDLAAVYARLYA